ncbi:MAG: choice-of-anchor D domain-containing protein, partial [Vicinamibacteria bacterium]|nr:choice-of-anchor D domain-containing protein [Vicinamibacteria bacterium]
AAFDPNPDVPVYSVALQADGKILVGGDFTSLQPNGAASPTTRNKIARLNADGSLDPGFDPNANSTVTSITPQPDGAILLGGNFNFLQPNGAASPTLRNFIARVNADGTLDPAFDPNANFPVFSVALQPDGRILLGGWFTTLQPNGASSPTARNHVARVNADGTLDGGFDPNADNIVFSLAVQADGSVLLGGQFNSLQPNGAASPTARSRIARVTAAGALDAGFDPSANGNVYTMAVQADGKIVLGGDFTFLVPNGVFPPTMRNFVARLNADGTLDNGFDPNASATVASVALQGDGRILLGGYFSSLQPNGAASAKSRSRFARLNNDAATQVLSSPDATQVSWIRGGASPEAAGVTFEQSLDSGATWTLLGAGARVGTTPNWQLTGLSLPSSGQLRARARVAGGYQDGSSGLVQALASFGPSPEIAVTGNATGIADGDFTPSLADDTDFGGLPVAGGLNARTYTITNTGAATLVLTGAPKVVVGGPDAADFTVIAPPVSPIGPGGSTTFQVMFDPSGLGLRKATLTIQDNDADENPFDFAIQGMGLDPNNSALSSLTTSLCSLSPSFSSGTTTYSCFAAFSDSSLTVTPTKAEPNAVIQVRINGGAWTSVNSGSPTAPLALNVGANPVDVRVTAQNPVFSTVYSVVVNRSPALPGDLDELVANVAGDYVLSTAVQPDRKILIAGSFTSVLGQPRNNIARLNADGSLDTGFNPNANSAIYTLVLQPDGKIVIGGYFTTLQPNGAPSATPRNRVARLNSDGTIDTAFNPNASGAVLCLALQTDGKIVLGGQFGSLQPNGAPSATQRLRIARVNADGTLDTGFDPKPNNVNSVIWTVAVQPDGKILIGGGFTSLQPNGAPSATPRDNMARLNSSGTLDAAFDPKPSSNVYTLALQPDGRILVGGIFTSLKPNGAPTATPRQFLARVNADGTLDSAFDPTPDNVPYTMALQADGRFLVGGAFSNLQPNGSPVPIAREGIARFNADGSLDPAFDPSAFNVRTVALQADGKILIGGMFTALRPNGAFASTARNYFARLLNDPAPQILSAPSPNEVSWVRSGGAPEIAQVTFEQSTNGGLSWVPLGDGVRVGATPDFQLTGLSLPASGLLRARGRNVGGYSNGASGLVESLASIAAAPEIAVFGNNIEIANGDGTPSLVDDTDFGGVNTDGGVAGRNFIAYNWGSADLNLGTISVSGPAAGDFIVGLDPYSPVTPANGSAFGIEFHPSARGPRTAVVSFATDDSDENPFTFTIRGTGTCPTITLGALPHGTTGMPYSGSLAALGGAGPYTYALTSGSLPPGLTLNSPGPGGLAGSPTSTGKFTFEITATDSGSPFTCAGARMYTVVIGSAIAPGDLVISQLRFRGAPSGADGTRNEFVEIHNRTSASILVGGEGLTLAMDNGTAIGVIPAGAAIPPSGFFLFANRYFCDCIGGVAGFSSGDLAAYPAGAGIVGSGDSGFLIDDIPDGAGIALFNGTALTAPARIDSVGFAGVEPGSPAPLYREGAGLTPGTGVDVDGEYAFVRRNVNSVAVDTGDNESDFVFISADARTYTGRVSQLGLPGPRRSTSGRSKALAFSVIDPAVAGSLPPNREVDASFTPHHLEFRFKVTNNTPQPITSLRWRFVTLTTLNGPAYANPNVADLRPITGSARVVPVTAVGPTTVEALNLELEGLQSIGGGLNSTLVYALPGPLASGASININIVFEKRRGGTFKFVTQVEAVP